MDKAEKDAPLVRIEADINARLAARAITVSQNLAKNAEIYARLRSSSTSPFLSLSMDPPSVSLFPLSVWPFYAKLNRALRVWKLFAAVHCSARLVPPPSSYLLLSAIEHRDSVPGLLSLRRNLISRPRNVIFRYLFCS